MKSVKQSILILMLMLPAISLANIQQITHIEYLAKNSTEMKVYHFEQAEPMLNAYLLNSTLSFQIYEERKDGRPLMMVLNNARSGGMSDKSTPYLDLPISFPTKKFRKNHTYTCTDKYVSDDECRIQMFPSYFYLKVPGNNGECKIRVEGNASFDQHKNEDGIYENLSFPSHDESETWAVSFDCYDKDLNVSVLKGYVLTNTKEIPKL